MLHNLKKKQQAAIRLLKKIKREHIALTHKVVKE